ncbi:hypothetical protein ABEB36_007366 [Hypothenemus hampei]|uniref:N-acetyltransferase ESCO2 n=1 Tax=Hypothenemus hampei TaxID=57062 RepID=A0ABD1ETQ7_HYPHA
MTSSRRNHLTVDQQRSPFISERRRKLFPAEDQEMESELGCTTPIHWEKNEPFLNARACSESMSPLFLTPGKTHLNDTPKKMASECYIQTPHDSSTKAVLEKKQKTLLEECKSSKRSISSPSSSPERMKSSSLDQKSSKVRTALFPQEPILPTSKFYANSSNKENLLEILRNKKHIIKPIRLNIRKAVSHVSLRKTLGQINKGVGHKIRKPKQRKIGKVPISKSTGKHLESEPALNAYIQDLIELKNKQKNIDKNAIQTNFSSVHDDKNIVRNQSVEIQKEENRTKNNQIKKSSQKLDFSYDFQEEDSETSTNIDNILSLLSNDSPTKLETQNITLEAHSSVIASENSIQLHHNTILSPISQMCDVTSGLAIHSPSKSRNSSLLPKISQVSKALSFDSSDKNVSPESKMYPIFYSVQRGEKRANSDVLSNDSKKMKGAKEVTTRSSILRSNGLKRLPSDQMLLDAGQKRFGVTICYDCNTLYHMGDPNDEVEHCRYHNADNVLHFMGWKNERVVANISNDSRIIKILPNDSKIWHKKVENLMKLINRELGNGDMCYDITESQVYLYIKNRVIAGCAVAMTPKGDGHRMLNTLSGIAMCSEESYPIKCGISYIWVEHQHRKQGVASSLLDAVKNNFIFGETLSNDEIGLSSPTEAGSAFAEKYFKTPNYMVYFV